LLVIDEREGKVP